MGPGLPTTFLLICFSSIDSLSACKKLKRLKTDLVVAKFICLNFDIMMVRARLRGLGKFLDADVFIYRHWAIRAHSEKFLIALEKCEVHYTKSI